MLFNKLIMVLKAVFQIKSTKQGKRILPEKINFTLRNKPKKEDAIAIYESSIRLLRELKMYSPWAENLVFSIHKDVLSNFLSFKDLDITEGELNKLLKRQKAFNLRIRFNLLRDPLYRGIGGGIIIQEIEDLIRNQQLIWKDLKIDRAEFYSVKNHIRAAK